MHGLDLARHGIRRNCATVRSNAAQYANHMKGQSFVKRLGFALAGLRCAARRESSFRTHLVATAIVFCVLGITRPAPLWWALCILAVGLVLVAELLNSALEALADRLHPEQHAQIRAAKDMAAAAVLVASITALLIAAMFALRS